MKVQTGVVSFVRDTNTNPIVKNLGHAKLAKVLAVNLLSVFRCGCILAV